MLFAVNGRTERFGTSKLPQGAVLAGLAVWLVAGATVALAALTGEITQGAKVPE